MSGPLPFQAHEDFAQAIARGEKGAHAYRRTHQNTPLKTCAEAASRLTRKHNVATRIEELKALKAQADAAREQEAAKEASKQLTGTLLSMDDRRRLMGQIAMDEKQDADTRMRAAMNDAKLAGDLIDKTDLTSEGQALPSAMPTIIFNPATPCGRRAKK